MAKNATGKSSTGKTSNKGTKKAGTSVARVSSSGSRGGGSGKQSGFDASEAFIKLLQSPLAAELVAVAATAALAALAEHGFTSASGNGRGKRAGKAVKEAGKAAAAAVGRRLTNELDEIRKAATAKGGAGA
jgi:hypothetical protein